MTVKLTNKIEKVYRVRQQERLKDGTWIHVVPCFLWHIPSAACTKSDASTFHNVREVDHAVMAVQQKC
jgi:hypothetical protein